MRAKDLKPIYKKKGFRNLEELALAAKVGREHLNNALNGRRAMSGELTERLAALLDIAPELINPDYRMMVELSQDEWKLVQSFRRISRDHQSSILPLILVMLEEASRDNAA